MLLLPWNLVEARPQSRSIAENVAKARRAFLISIGGFHGKLNPRTGHSLYETFVLPILLYGCESWILSHPLISVLEKFQSEIGRRILRLSRFHSDIAPVIGLHLPSIKARVLMRKLTFLAKLISSNDSNLSARVFRTLCSDNVYDIGLVHQCQFLANEIGVASVLARCLEHPDISPTIVRSSRLEILRLDWSTTLENARTHLSVKHLVCSTKVASSWGRIWDLALDHGAKGTCLFQHLFSSLCRPVFGERKCPHCEGTIPHEQTFFGHLCDHHIDFDADALPRSYP